MCNITLVPETGRPLCLPASRDVEGAVCRLKGGIDQFDSQELQPPRDKHERTATELARTAVLKNILSSMLKIVYAWCEMERG